MGRRFEPVWAHYVAPELEIQCLRGVGHKMKMKEKSFQLLRRVFELCKFLIFRKVVQRRFIPLSISSSTKQRVYDRNQKKILNFNIHDSDEYAALSQIFFREDYNVGRFNDTRVQRRYEEIIHSGRTPLILDLGANIGLAAKYFDLIYPFSKIILVEPSSNNLDRAKEEFPFSNLNFIQAAIGPNSGSVKLHNLGDGKNSFRVEVDPQGEIVMLSVPEAISKYGEECTPFVCKIDIEGFESELFSSESAWIHEFYMVIIELHDYMFQGEGKSRNFLEKISKLDRDFIHVGENTFSIKNSK